MDPILTEIMKNRFTAMAEEASTVAYRTAHTTFVKQTQDFQVALATLDGEFFAYPTMTGVTNGSGDSISGMVKAIDEKILPGDVIVSNDPFNTGGLATHIMDVHLVQPIYHQGELVCYAWSFVHASDVGGAVPGSISPDLSEVYQEGLRLRPAKLVREGVLNRDIVGIIKDNSRIGEAVWGDLEALMSAMRLLSNRVNELCEKMGVAAFREGVAGVLSYSERKAREIIGQLKDGTYTFADYIEGAEGSEPILLHCSLTIDGDEAEIDYSGSSPQVRSALNFYSGERSHPFLCLGLTNYIYTMAPTMPVNGGSIRPIRARAPLGSVMNAEFPASSGNRWVSVMRIYDTLIGCLNQAIEGGIAACGAGQGGIISASWIDAATGRSRVSVVEPFSGGSGARVRGDGVDANDTMIGYLKSTPVEYVEVEVPLVVHRYELVSDVAGHGKYRGGAAIRIEIEARVPELKIAVRGLDRFRFQPWGVYGGHPGSNSAGEVIRADGRREVIGMVKVLTLFAGDRLLMTSSAGGGFGPAETRDPDLVLRDVLDGFISAETAREIYGVEIDGDRIAADKNLSRGGEGSEFADTAIAIGPAREAFEALWPVEASVEYSKAILALPFGLRGIVGSRARAELEGHDGQLTPQAVRRSVEAHAAALAA
ncbi:hydantoinase B/oxoprolinase family protein [Pararhizobium arenae]|uniref:hydantoinase B/oxoprolinase family protein n=1 Tax=Pararhizobium arenae TaxID=1856850 RepID=UPI00094B1249|nr:hydantoinase B/oxoprolinase family protein [Pararhizobium arenae]